MVLTRKALVTPLAVALITLSTHDRFAPSMKTLPAQLGRIQDKGHAIDRCRGAHHGEVCSLRGSGGVLRKEIGRFTLITVVVRAQDCR